MSKGEDALDGAAHSPIKFSYVTAMVPFVSLCEPVGDWVIANRGEMHHDPIVFAYGDPASWVAGLLTLAIVVARCRNLK